MAPINFPKIDWSKIEASAPGKFIISGEYSVVYEKHAIASAIDLRTTAIIRPNQEDEKVRLNLTNLKSIREWPLTSLTMCRLVSKYSKCLDFDETMPVALDLLMHPRYEILKPSLDRQKAADDAAMAFLLLYIGLGDSFGWSARPAIDVKVESSIPVGSGLGSSSAFSVALCGALMKVFRVSAEKYVISNWAFNIDKYFHGRPSGVDNSIVTSGGHILFRNGKVVASGISHKAPMRVMLIETGVSRSTKTLSETVVKQLQEDPTKVNRIFSNINDLTTQIWAKLNDPNFIPRNISGRLQANQELLDELGVGHEKLTDIFTRAQRFNLTAKQTGAGGGGTAFVLYIDNPENCEIIAQLRTDLKGAGYNVHDHAIGCEGLLVKSVAANR